jgi:hypothetical protein
MLSLERFLINRRAPEATIQETDLRNPKPPLRILKSAYTDKFNKETYCVFSCNLFQGSLYNV